ncbi:PilZ domain-containing protein [Thiohalobacter sp. IOR34]|uniref:PilZ domain-containing protein n=1 Tax=Thiohalobacter sp. IOR34 TaxID=3057176 RepID=UPI0025B25826|nr:PilZ domain-containing protein [Thiohalobacter sp. IOR34]WJW76533.1 PilZ domain-containing protein [Thiohalobacter sp. IOR34]
MNDKRKQVRTEISAEIEVRDHHSGEPVGRLVNLSPSGMMLFVGREIAPHSVYQFDLLLPGVVLETDTLTLGAESLWCQPCESGEFCAGFHLIDIPPDQQDVLAALIQGE